MEGEAKSRRSGDWGCPALSFAFFPPDGAPCQMEAGLRSGDPTIPPPPFA